MFDDHDRRQSPRQLTFTGGRIVFNAGRSTIDCTVRNVSPMGAKLQVGSVAGIPNTFDLIIGDAPPRPCRVIWRALKEMGVAFAPREDEEADAQ